MQSRPLPIPAVIETGVTPHTLRELEPMAIMQVHITKAGKSAVLPVNTDDFSEDIYHEIVAAGLSVLLNSRMSKVGAVTKLEGDDLAGAQAKALAIASENLAKLADGTYKFPGQKAKSPEKREVLNEAIRLARDVVRDALRAANVTISHVAAKDITAAAKQLVDTDATYIAKAKENLARRNEVPTGIDIAALGLVADPSKVAKAEAAKEARKNGPISAKQAGQVQARTTKSKPKADAGAVLAGLSQGVAVQHVH